jgi:hypothetical protein
MADVKKKPKGEPGAAAQVNKVAGLNDDEIIKNALRAQAGYGSTRGGWYQESLESQASNYRKQAQAERPYSQGAYDAKMYVAGVLDNYIKQSGKGKEQQEQGTRDSAVAPKKKKITANQGIIASQLNLGGSGLLGG